VNLKVLLPAEVLIDREVDKIAAEAENGAFSLLPRHIDFVAALAPGLLSYGSKGRESFLAVDGGILVKCGQNVLVSTRNAVEGGELGELERIVAEKFNVLDDKEKTARSAIAKIEAGFIRRFLEVQKRV
jgi:F-type H+-transporting ATPase subunit epsilon